MDNKYASIPITADEINIVFFNEMRRRFKESYWGLQQKYPLSRDLNKSEPEVIEPILRKFIL